MRTFTVTVKTKKFAQLAPLTATVEAENAFKAVDAAVEQWGSVEPIAKYVTWGVHKFDGVGALVLKPYLD